MTAGNVAYRVRKIYRNARLTLNSIGPGGPSAIISVTKFIGDDPFVTRFWERGYGINVEPYPSTEARLAGLSPIASDAHAIVEAFKARGSALKSAANVDDVAPKWLLSPPTGLAGVTEIAIEGFAKHLHTARYSLAGTAEIGRAHV